MKLNNNQFSFPLSNLKPAACGSLVLLLAIGLFLPACKQDAGTPGKQATSTPAKSDHAGTYNLVTINDKKLPCTPPHEGGAPEVQSGSLTLNADGTLSSTTSFKIPSGQVASREVGGTYTRDGARFTMQWKGAGMTTATLEGNTFIMDNEGMLFAYRK